MKSSLFKALGLCALVVGLTMAFGAVAAHAEKGSFWLVNKKTFSEGLLPKLEAETDVEGKLLATIGPGTLIDINCSTILLINAHLVEPLGKLLGEAVFHGCDFLTLKEGVATKQAACTPRDAAGNLGLIVSNKVEGLIKLHKEGTKEDPVVELKPAVAGQPFADIFLGEECGFGEHVKVEGTWFIEDCELRFLEDLVKHLVVENKLTLLKVNGGAHTAHIDGSTWVFLGGEHKGMTWAGHPG